MQHSSPLFRDRTHAGTELANHLLQYSGADNTYIFALVRGGVIVGRAVADRLNLPLYPCIVRKINHPTHREFGLGAISGEGAMYLDEMTLSDHGFSYDHLEPLLQQERTEFHHRRQLFAAEKNPNVEGATVLLVDDGAATGISMMAAIADMHTKKAKEVIVCLPVCAPDLIAAFEHEVSKVICHSTPSPFNSVSEWYEYFPQVSNEEALAFLHAQVG
ncbi:MAG: hypothetical protein KBD00_04900 [Candidatus Peribacteraceae bacterium]|nr:hypothetical protein [Candidatus Peribacteraceae bacterium]